MIAVSYARTLAAPRSRARARAARGMGAEDLFPGAVGAGSGVPKGVDATMYLIAQINRFMGPAAPGKLRLGDTPLPLASGKIGVGAATLAIVLLDHRTGDGDAFEAAPEANARVKGAYANPVGFVEKNMAEVVSTIQQFGDVLGAPPAQFPGAATSGTGKLVALALGAGILFMLWGKH